MVKTLQKKFIRTAMLAISLLLLISLGAVNVFYVSRVRNEIRSTLAMLAENEGMHFDDTPENAMEKAAMQKEEPETGGGERENRNQLPPETEPIPPEQKQKRPNIFNPEISEDMAMATRFFLVQLDEKGQVATAYVRNLSSMDEKTAVGYALEVWQSGKTDGRKLDFCYTVRSMEGKQTTIVFLNVSRERQLLLSVFLISTFIGIVGWLLMLLLVTGLSRRAILPIAKNLEKQKQFVTDAGHEIKTPLAIIQANTDALELHTEETKWSRNIRKQTERLNGLMQNLLTLSRTEEGTRRIQTQEIDLNGLAMELVEAFAESAERKQIHLQTAMETSVTLCADREDMIRLLSILLENAIKYSPEKKTVTLSLTTEAKNVVLRCENECAAMPDVEAERLFDRFYRYDAARTQKNGGYGIGLSVAKAIVQSYKGRIRAEYKENNQIVFTVWL